MVISLIVTLMDQLCSQYTIKSITQPIIATHYITQLCQNKYEFLNHASLTGLPHTHMYRDTYRNRYIQTDTYRDRYIHTDRQTDTYRQTHTHTHTSDKHICIHDNDEHIQHGLMTCEGFVLYVPLYNFSQ